MCTLIWRCVSGILAVGLILASLYLIYQGRLLPGGEYASGHGGFLFGMLGGVAASAGISLLFVRGGLADWGFGDRIPMHLLAVALIGTPLIAGLLMYGSTSWSDPTISQWSGFLAALGAFIGVNAAVLAFEPVSSPKANLQKVLTAMSACAAAAAVLLSRGGY